MKSNWKLTVNEWHTLSHDGKEKLRNWSVNHGYELDLIPGKSVDFDPACEYAALLTIEQMKIFLKENKQEIPGKYSGELLWKCIVKMFH